MMKIYTSSVKIPHQNDDKRILDNIDFNWQENDDLIINWEGNISAPLNIFGDLEAMPESILVENDDGRSYFFSNKTMSKQLDDGNISNNVTNFVCTYTCDIYHTIYKQMKEILSQNNPLVRIKKRYSNRIRVLFDETVYDTSANYPEAKMNIPPPILTQVDNFTVSASEFCQNNQISEDYIEYLEFNQSVEHNFTTNDSYTSPFVSSSFWQHQNRHTVRDDYTMIVSNYNNSTQEFYFSYKFTFTMMQYGASMKKNTSVQSIRAWNDHIGDDRHEWSWIGNINMQWWNLSGFTTQTYIESPTLSFVDLNDGTTGTCVLRIKIDSGGQFFILLWNIDFPDSNLHLGHTYQCGTWTLSGVTTNGWNYQPPTQVKVDYDNWKDESGKYKYALMKMSALRNIANLHDFGFDTLDSFVLVFLPGKQIEYILPDETVWQTTTRTVYSRALKQPDYEGDPDYESKVFYTNDRIIKTISTPFPPNIVSAVATRSYFSTNYVMVDNEPVGIPIFFNIIEANKASSYFKLITIRRTYDLNYWLPDAEPYLDWNGNCANFILQNGNQNLQIGVDKMTKSVYFVDALELDQIKRNSTINKLTFQNDFTVINYTFEDLQLRNDTDGTSVDIGRYNDNELWISVKVNNITTTNTFWNSTNGFMDSRTLEDGTTWDKDNLVLKFTTDLRVEANLTLKVSTSVIVNSDLVAYLVNIYCYLDITDNFNLFISQSNYSFAVIDNVFDVEGNTQCGNGWITNSDNYNNYYANNYTTIEYGMKQEQDAYQEKMNERAINDKKEHVKDIFSIATAPVESLAAKHTMPGLLGKGQKLIGANPIGKVANVVIDTAMTGFNIAKKWSDIAVQRGKEEEERTAHREANQVQIQNKKNQPSQLIGNDSTYSKLIWQGELINVKVIHQEESEKYKNFMYIVNNGMEDGRVHNFNEVFNRILFNYISIDTTFNDNVLRTILLNDPTNKWNENFYINMFFTWLQEEHILYINNYNADPGLNIEVIAVNRSKEPWYSRKEKKPWEK